MRGFCRRLSETCPDQLSHQLPGAAVLPRRKSPCEPVNEATARNTVTDL